jgi:DNA-binding transcriptional LysR family regulator
MEPSSIDLNLLSVFQEVYRARQISAAARRLGLTQSAVSNALARLRKTFGDELFVRTAHGMQPTPLAQQMAEPIGAAMAQVALALSQRSRFDAATSTRRFTLAMTDVGEVYFMPTLIERCRALAPNVEIASSRVNGLTLKEDMETGRVDLAIGAFEDVSEALYQRQLFRQRFVTMFRKGHPFGRGTVDLARFAAATHLIVDAAQSPYDRINTLLAKAGVGAQGQGQGQGQGRYRVPHFTAVPYIVATSELVVTVPQKLAESAAGPFGLAWIEPPLQLPTLQTNVFWHRRFNHDPGIGWLRGLIVEVFAE